MKRLKYFDTVKGIGILLVVLGHATFVNERLLTFIFSFHMPLFFIVSGMLTAYKDGSGSTLRDVFYRKLKTIIIPYLCFSICYTLIDILSVYFGQISLNDLKINLVCTGSFAGSGPLWFLPTLFICEIIFNVLLKKTGKKYGIIISLIISFSGFLIWHFFEPVYTASKSNLTKFFLLSFIFVIIRSMVCLIFLALSYTLFKIAKVFSGDDIKGYALPVLSGVILLIICAVLSGLNTNIDIHNMDFGNIILFLLNAFCGSVGLILICRFLPEIKPLSIVHFWGKNSLIIMATHLNFYILFLGNVIAYKINPYIKHAKEYVLLFNIMLITMAVETLFIFLINRYIPWMSGKSKNK